VIEKHYEGGKVGCRCNRLRKEAFADADRGVEVSNLLYELRVMICVRGIENQSLEECSRLCVRS
jgi:hypothetical protein